MKRSYRLRPWFEAGIAMSTFALAGISLTFFHHDPQTSIYMLFIMTGTGSIFAWFGIREWNSVHIMDKELRVQSFSEENIFAIHDVECIRICRAVKLFMFNNVELVIPGFRRLTVMRYIGFGRKILQESHSLAEMLDVPLIDKERARLQKSRLVLLRWRANGDDWAYLLSISLLCFVPTVSVVHFIQ